MRLLIGLTVFIAPAIALGDDPARHLLSGAEAFQRGAFSEALVEFRVAEQRLGPGEATWYLGASLVKLERHDEAVVAFDRAREKAPSFRDPVLDYYHALAMYGAHLYLAADALLAEIGDRAGPKIGDQAARIRIEIASSVKTTSPERIDWYLAKGGAAIRSNQPRIARIYFVEATQLAERNGTLDRKQELEAQVATAERMIDGTAP